MNINIIIEDSQDITLLVSIPDSLILLKVIKICIAESVGIICAS